MSEVQSYSRYYQVLGNFGITVNLVVNTNNSKRVSVINCVEQHEPRLVATSFGEIKRCTLSRISTENFSDINSAKDFILTRKRR